MKFEFPCHDSASASCPALNDKGGSRDFDVSSGSVNIGYEHRFLSTLKENRAVKMKFQGQ